MHAILPALLARCATLGHLPYPVRRIVRAVLREPPAAPGAAIAFHAHQAITAKLVGLFVLNARKGLMPRPGRHPVQGVLRVLSAVLPAGAIVPIARRAITATLAQPLVLHARRGRSPRPALHLVPTVPRGTSAPFPLAAVARNALWATSATLARPFAFHARKERSPTQAARHFVVSATLARTLLPQEAFPVSSARSVLSPTPQAHAAALRARSIFYCHIVMPTDYMILIKLMRFMAQNS